MRPIFRACVVFLTIVAAWAFYDRASEVARLQKMLEAEREEFREYKETHPAAAVRGSAASVKGSTGDAGAAKDEDLPATNDIAARRARGEYFLMSELPGPNRAEEQASEEALALAPQYNALFSELGVSPEQSAFLQNHLFKIRLASTKISWAINEMIEAQQAFKSRAAGLLGKESYAKYTEFENSQLTRRDMDSIKALLQGPDKQLDAATEGRVIALIRESGAYRPGEGGPFDGPPLHLEGTGPILAHLQTEFFRLKEATTVLTQRAAEAALPEATMAALTEHYANRLKEAEIEVGRLRELLRSERLRAEGNVPLAGWE